MGSNEREDHTTTTRQHHPPHISSLVVRTSGSNDGEVDRLAATGDVSRDRPSFPRSDRHKADNGHRTRPSSTSPPRRPYEDHRHGSDLNHSGVAPPRGREFSGRRESSGRYRDYSPPRHVRGGAGGRRFDGPEPAHKVQPRDGDWYCLDPLCRNLNFARREVCYKCKRHRYARANSPPPPPMNLSPRRDFNGYRSSPPRGYPRDYPPPRLDHPTWRDRDRLRYSDLEYPPSRRIVSDWVHPQPLPKPHYERRPPLSPPPGGRWERRHSRERSRSPPLRDGPPPHPMRGGGQPSHPMRSRSPPLRDGPPPPHPMRGGPPPHPMRGGGQPSHPMRSRSPPLRDGPPPPHPMRGGPPPLRYYRRDSYFDRRGDRDRM